MISARVTIKTPGLTRAQQELARMNQVPPPPAVARMYDQWAVAYSSFVRRRFDRFSKGGGDWPPLALSTIRARTRYGRGSIGAAGKTTPSPGRVTRGKNKGSVVASGRQVAILRDTGALFNALTIGAPGNVKTFIPYGVRFGIGGPVIHTRPAVLRRILRSGKEAKNKVRGHVTGSMTIGRIAAIHDGGEGHNPRRLIIAQPDANTTRIMAKYAKAMLVSLVRGGGA